MATAAEMRREKLRNRSRQAVQTREQKGLGKKSVLDWGKFDGKKPNTFEPKKGKDKNLIDILPFVITQKWYKDLQTFSGLKTGLDVGDWDYKLELPVHKNVGENNDTLLCLKLAFGGKCARCDDMSEEYDKDEYDQKVINALKPVWRTWYNVYDYDEGENPDGENRIWEDFSFHLFEKYVLEEADEGEETILYTDIEIGKSIEFRGKEKKIGKYPFTECHNINFVKRDPYGEDIVEETVSFDSIVKVCTADEFTNIHLGMEGDGEKEKESPFNDEEKEEKTNTRSRRRPKKEEEEEVGNIPKDECPNGLTFGNPDLDSKKCKSCDDKIFDICAAEGDLKEKEEEKEEKPTSGRRRRNRK